MLVTCRQMQEIEARAFQRGIRAADLMQQAGQGIAEIVRQFYPQPGTLVLYLGTGHNAGDALVAGRVLASWGWAVQARLSLPVERMKPLPLQLLAAFTALKLLETAPCVARGPLLLMDGLLGIGAQGPMRPEVRALAVEMNALRLAEGAVTVALDVPSGLDADTGVPGPEAVIADVTATIAYAKVGLVADAAVSHVGRLALVPLAELAAEGEGQGGELLTAQLVRSWLPRRAFDLHKGQAGRVGILAGSPGFFGAAELACRGALRAGAGLVTLIVKEAAYPILAQRVPAEVMVRTVQDYREVLDLRFDSLGIGPGLGLAAAMEYLEVIRASALPMVVDADALTALAQHPMPSMAGPRLLTPHPGEMARIGEIKLTRRDTAESFVAQRPGITLLLKGARTVIATQGHETLFNTTGHSGMATGGMGDVLTGVAAALLGQGLTPHTSAGAAAWLCGRAAEIATLGPVAQESILPSDVVACLGRAWAGAQSGGGCY